MLRTTSRCLKSVSLTKCYRFVSDAGQEAAPAVADAPDFVERSGEGFDLQTGMADIVV